MNIIPERWHLYIVDLEPRVGTKPGKQRPCSNSTNEFAAADIQALLFLLLQHN